MKNKSTTEETEYKCPECGEMIVRRKGISKHTGKEYDFFACSDYPDCEKTFGVLDDDTPDFDGKLRSKAEESKYECPECGKPLVRRQGISKSTKKEYDFFACSGYPECKKTFDVLDDDTPDFDGKLRPKTEASKHKCPECGKLLVRKKGVSKKTGKEYDFFACSGYPDCEESFSVTDDDQPDFGIVDEENDTVEK